MSIKINNMIGALSMLAVAGANAATLSINPSTLTVAPGSTFSATIQADFSDVTGGTAGGGVAVTWDTNVLTLNQSASGASNEIFSILTSQFINNFGDAGFTFTAVKPVTGSGMKSLDFSFILCPLTSACDTLSIFNVFDLVFDVNPLANGPTLLTLSENGIHDPWFESDGVATISNVSYAGSATINAVALSGVVPVPASIWLFGSGLLGMVGVARRRLSTRHVTS